MPSAVAYYRTSSPTNTGEGKDSALRQQEAVRAYAVAHGLEIVGEFYDKAVPGADHLGARPGFVELLAAAGFTGASVILVGSGPLKGHGYTVAAQ